MGPDVLDDLVGGDPAVAGIVVGLPQQGPGQVVGEETESGRQSRVVVGLFPLSGRREGQEVLRQAAPLPVERLVRRLGRDLAGMTRVREQHLPPGLDAVRHDVAQRRHGVGGLLEAAPIDVRRGQVPPAVLDEPVADEIDGHPIGRLRHRRQPLLDLAPDGGQRGLPARQHPDVLRRKRAAFLADEHAVHLERITLGKRQLLGCVQIGIVAHADYEGIAARHGRRAEIRGDLGGAEHEIAGADRILLTLTAGRLTRTVSRRHHRRQPRNHRRPCAARNPVRKSHHHRCPSAAASSASSSANRA